MRVKGSRSISDGFLIDLRDGESIGLTRSQLPVSARRLDPDEMEVYIRDWLRNRGINSIVEVHRTNPLEVDVHLIGEKPLPHPIRSSKRGSKDDRS